MRRIFFVLFVLMVCTTAPAALADQSTPATNLPNPPLTFSMIADSSSISSNGTVGVTLAVNSATDMPVPYVTVYVSKCAIGQQTPWRLAHRTRHLANGESLTLDKVGNLKWSMFSAPPNYVPAQTLHLEFVLPSGLGGPYYCIHASGYTNEGSMPTASYEIGWPDGKGGVPEV